MAVDRGALEDLIRDLGAVPPAVQRELRPALQKATQPTLQRIRQNGSWSMRIPDAVRISTSFGKTPGVTLRVDAGKAPGARPIEHDGQPGTFRRPVYARGDRNTWTWRPQAARPFFYRAVEETADQVRDALGDALMGVAERHGF